MQIEQRIDEAVTLEGQWQPDPDEPTAGGLLQVLAIREMPATEAAKTEVTKEQDAQRVRVKKESFREAQ